MIEQGRLILTMMPSLYCKLDCPHCYLTKEQRRSKESLTLEQIKSTIKKINRYYKKKDIHAAIDIYWYGGEPTTMGVDLFSDMCDIINIGLKTHRVKHILLSALVGVDIDNWSPVIKKYCSGKIQTSYDGLMRGQRYDATWQKQVTKCFDNGISVNTLSVFNKKIQFDGYQKTFIKLMELGIRECGWLPFQKNTRNDYSGMYEEHSTSMSDFSDFMINFTKLNNDTHTDDGSVFLIGNELFINSMDINGVSMSNTGAQTVFLMPNGDIVMPDYDNLNVEYMRLFGNILTQSFEQVLTSKSRRDWIRRQINRNNNKECLSCNFWNCCLMEFWKNNNKNDDCYGAKKYVEWLQFSDDTTIQKIRINTTIENIS